MISTVPLDDRRVPARTPAFRLHFAPHPLASPSPHRGEGFHLHSACILLMLQAA
jgi:hypothetical protein